MENQRNEFDVDHWIDNRLSHITLSGGGGSAPSGQTTTTSNTTPWVGQQSYLTGGTLTNDGSGGTSPNFGQKVVGTLPEAERLYNTGGPQYFNGPTVASQSAPTLQAQQQELAFGSNANPTINSTTGALGSILNSNFNGSTPGQGYLTDVAGANNPALGIASQQAQYGAPGSGVLSGIAGYGGPTADQRYLTPYANGSMVGANPYLNAEFNTMAGNISNAYQTSIAPQITSGLESGNRYGSGVAANAQAQGERQLASQLATAGTQLYGQDYEQQTQNQINAANSISQAQQAQLAGQTNAASALGQNAIQSTGLLGQIGNTQAQAQIAAATALGNDYNNNVTNQVRALFAAPSVSDLPLQQAAATSDVGNQQDLYNQALLNSQIQQYNYNQMLPYNNLSTYQQMISGNYGGQTTNSSPYYGGNGSQLGGALSGAASGAAIGTMFGPGYGTAIGAGIGGLAGLFAR